MNKKRIFAVCVLLIAFLLSAFSVLPGEETTQTMTISQLRLEYGTVFKIDKVETPQPGIVPVWIGNQHILIMDESRIRNDEYQPGDVLWVQSTAEDKYQDALLSNGIKDIRPGLALISADTKYPTMTIVPDMSSAIMVSARTLENRQVEVTRIIEIFEPFHDLHVRFGNLLVLSDGRVLGIDYSFISTEKGSAKGFLHFETDADGRTTIELNPNPRDAKKDALIVKTASDLWSSGRWNWPIDPMFLDAGNYSEPTSPETACQFMIQYWDNAEPGTIDLNELESYCGQLDYVERYHWIAGEVLFLSSKDNLTEYRHIILQKRPVATIDILNSTELSAFGVTMTDTTCPFHFRHDRFNPNDDSVNNARLFLLPNTSSFCAMPGEIIQFKDVTEDLNKLSATVDIHNYHSFLVPQWPEEK